MSHVFNMGVLLQVNAAAEIINDLVDPSANLIFGAVIDPNLSGQVSYRFQSMVGDQGGAIAHPKFQK